MMESQGLLGAFSAPQQAAAPQPAGGLLGSAGSASPQDIQLATQLSQNPTPQMAQQVVQQLKQSGNPNAGQLEQAFSQAGGDPEFIKHIADTILQKMQGQA